MQRTAIARVIVDLIGRDHRQLALAAMAGAALEVGIVARAKMDGGGEVSAIAEDVAIALAPLSPCTQGERGRG